MRFNSSMVRLGGDIDPTLPVAIGFQFQYGAIGSVIQWDIKLSELSFNSSMVRLGVSDYVKMAVAERCFNSSMVRLGGSAAV